MRLAGIYLNDNDVLALAERLRKLGLDGAAGRVMSAYYHDASELDIAPSELHRLIPELENGPASFQALRESLTGRSTAIAGWGEAPAERR
jgi:hypothetical protein